MKTTFRIISSSKELFSIKKDWDTLYHSGNFDIFQSFEWFYLWWKYFGQDLKLFCLCFYNEKSDLIFVAPLIISIEGNNRILRFSGGNLSDYNFLITHAGYTNGIIMKIFYTTIMQFMGTHFDEIQLKHVNLLKHNMLEFHFQESGLALQPLEDELAMKIVLPGSLEEYYGQIEGKRKKVFDYYERNVFKKLGFQFNFLEEKQDIEKYTRWFEEQKKYLWKQYNLYERLPPEIQHEDFFNYLNDIILANQETKFLLIPCITKDDMLLASGFYFYYKNTVFKFMQSWDYNYKSSSIGTVLDWKMIQYSIINGFKYFDLGRGDEAYKSRFGALPVTLSGFRVTCQ